jgi:hypothetical protein
MKPATRRTWLAASVVVLLALIWFAPGEDDSISAPALDKSTRSRKVVSERGKPATPNASRAAGTTTQNLQLLHPNRAAQPDAIPDLFAAVSWYVAPPPPPEPPPPPPSAPPLPFVYLGQYIEGDQHSIMLTRGARLLSVRMGEVIDKTYQVVSLQDGQLTFLFLPLNVSQSLATGTHQ